MIARQIYTFPLLTCCSCNQQGAQRIVDDRPYCSARCQAAGPRAIAPMATPPTEQDDTEMARGRPKGSTNKPKDGAPAGIGDNSKPKPVATANQIAQALAEVTDFSVQIASLSGRKGAAIKRWEGQGVDRELLASLAKLASKSPEEASAYITGLTKYATAADVIILASHEWTASLQQAELFTSDGDAADELKRARAHKQGFLAGKKGHDIQSSPYQSNPCSIEFVGWRAGHGEGTVLRAVIKPGSENIKTASQQKQRVDPPKPSGDEAAELGAAVAKELAEADAPAGRVLN